HITRSDRTRPVPGSPGTRRAGLGLRAGPGDRSSQRRGTAVDVHPHRDAGDDDVRPVPQLPGEDQVDVVVQEPVTLAEAVDAEEWFDMIAELPAEYSGLIPERSAGDEERPGPGSGDPGRGRC